MNSLRLAAIMCAVWVIGGSAQAPDTVIPGKVLIGTGEAVGSMAPLEIVWGDAGLAITATNPAPATEAYVAGFIRDADGNNRKVGATAFQFTDPNTFDGFASWNVHTSFFYAPGYMTDELQFATWGLRGAAFWPNTLAADQAPGWHILRVNGDVYAVNTIRSRDGLYDDTAGAPGQTVGQLITQLQQQVVDLQLRVARLELCR